MKTLFNLIGLDIKGGSLHKIRGKSRRQEAFSLLLDFRTTSRLEDEPVCLASMLRLEQDRIAAIQSAPASQRMMSFYINCGWPSLTWAFMASQSSDRLQIPGFRWAPSSFLGGDNQGSWPTLNEQGDVPDPEKLPERAFAALKPYDWTYMQLMPHPSAGDPEYVLEIKCPGFRLYNPSGISLSSPPHQFSFMYRDCMFRASLDDMYDDFEFGHIALVLHNDPQAVERCYVEHETFQTRAFVINHYDLYADVASSRPYVVPYSCVATVWWHRSGQRDRSLVGASDLPYQFKVHGEMLPYGTTWLIS
ncbi:hypothetical protein BFW01_g11701 [Lasiodiplodia theobromae]|nr:hypothetical protein BFW01_g11701 [Lasiodiplodia theobromae]